MMTKKEELKIALELVESHDFVPEFDEIDWEDVDLQDYYSDKDIESVCGKYTGWCYDYIVDEIKDEYFKEGSAE